MLRADRSRTWRGFASKRRTASRCPGAAMIPMFTEVECNVPDGVHEIVARLDVICNGPAVEASGHLSYGNNSVGMINWSTCLLYPDGPSCDDTMVRLSLRLPRGWRFATALKAERPATGKTKSRPATASPRSRRSRSTSWSTTR